MHLGLACEPWAMRLTLPRWLHLWAPGLSELSSVCPVSLSFTPFHLCTCTWNVYVYASVFSVLSVHACVCGCLL